MKTIDYLVASLPALVFDAPAPMTAEEFKAQCEGVDYAHSPAWLDLETQLKNARAEMRQAAPKQESLGGSHVKLRPSGGCSLYWKSRVASCFQEKNPAEREKLLDRVWWDAAGELTSPIQPLGRGALETYAVRLAIALKRSRISTQAGNAVFDRLTASTASNDGLQKEEV